MIRCRPRFPRCLMWTTENRQRYNRENLRYPSDLTDEEWSLVEQMIPSAKRGGRRREVDVREIPQWHHVCPEYRTSVEIYPQGPAAAKHAERVSPALAV